MTSSEIATQRIINQQLAGTKFKSANEIVSWMGAMQAQDYGMAKWAIGVRLTETTDKMIEQAINAGKIIRDLNNETKGKLSLPEIYKWFE